MAGPVEVTSRKVRPRRIYSSSEIALYGVQFCHSPVSIGNNVANVRLSCRVAPTLGNHIPALIFAFSYQGHFYSLPEPVVMIVYSPPGPLEPATEYAAGYYVWYADKLDKTAQISFINDTFEELILKKNTGDARQPTAYHAMLQMSHRGGKLME